MLSVVRHLIPRSSRVAAPLAQRCFSTSAPLVDGKFEVTPMLTPSDIPSHIQSPYKAGTFDTKPSPFGVSVADHVPTLDADGQARLRNVCAIAREVLDHAGKHVEPGITTEEINKIVFDKIISMNAFPAALGYHGFPKSVCTSVNEVLCHGIPDTRPLEEGDIVNLDLVVFKDEFYGDLSETYAVGKISEEDQRLIDATALCMWEGIRQCQAGKNLRAVGGCITDIAHSFAFNVSPDFAGHGIGGTMHQAPLVLHVPNSFEHFLQPGTALTVEPILTPGDPAFTKWRDEWTIVSVDKSRSAQFEQTILIQEDGIEILTARPDQPDWIPREE